MLGSVSMRALAESCVPTMVVRGAVRDAQDVVLVAVDIEDPADDLLDFAFTEAARRRARLEAVSVWNLSWAADYAGDTEEVRQAAERATEDLEAALEAVVRAWHAKHPDVRTSHRVLDGTPSAVLTAASSHADLIVAGARHHGEGGTGCAWAR
ncbi:universal stress protein [Catenulispora yoronensis]